MTRNPLRVFISEKDRGEYIGAEYCLHDTSLKNIFVRYHTLLLRPYDDAFSRTLKPGPPKINADRFFDNVALVPPLALCETVELTGNFVVQTY